MSEKNINILLVDDEELPFEEGELKVDFITKKPFKLLELKRQINDLFNAE
ncbi:MAG: hypothetical protein H8D23_20355 [Candidatus Brocadiales bacterium]|nr:hypothetical protein [Candidatus Brocadiales bacterium]